MQTETRAITGKIILVTFIYPMSAKVQHITATMAQTIAISKLLFALPTRLTLKVSARHSVLVDTQNQMSQT